MASFSGLPSSSLANFFAGLALPSQSTLVRQLVENYIPIALATFIEPFWLILNRLLSILRPFEELRKGCARSAKSIDVDYASLPPQLLFVRAYRAGHYLLALIGFVVLSANVLSVSLSGMMYEGTSTTVASVSLTALKAPKFRSLNGTGLPFNTNDTANFQGVTTSDPFYRMMSNLTADTPLPGWTDANYAYLPMDVSGIDVNSTVQLSTTAFGADLVCDNTTTSNHTYSLTFSRDATAAFLNVSLAKGDGSFVSCTDFKPWTGDTLRDLDSPQEGRVALEIGVLLASNASAADDLFCRQHIFASWIRSDWKTTEGKVTQYADSEYYGSRNMTITSRNETTLICTPNLKIGKVDVVVNSEGQVQKGSGINLNSTLDENDFTADPANLIAQANQFLIDNGGAWHTDSYPSDFVNYLIKKRTSDASLLNATLPVPAPGDAAFMLGLVYRGLYAILVSTNSDLLFEDVAKDDITSGTLRTNETRILFSVTAFAITEAILACYVLTTLAFYFRRPWRVLPRLPSTVASNIAYFAASRGVYELYSMHNGGSESLMRSVRSSWAWGYGTFLGTDGRAHVGIEKEPLVSSLKKGALSVSSAGRD